MKKKDQKSYEICPICKQNDEVIPIVYGLRGKEVKQDLAEGKIKLGGCKITENAPQWYCKRDKTKF